MQLGTVAIVCFMVLPATIGCSGGGAKENSSARLDTDGVHSDELDEAGSSEHRFCGWLHEFPDAKLTELGYDTFAKHARAFDAVHPKWWRIDTPSTFVNHPADRETPYGGFDDDRVLRNTTYGGRRTKLIPLIAGSMGRDVLTVHQMINDPALRKEHVAHLVDLAVSHRYDGVDIDYEHFARGIGQGQTRATERVAFSAFIDELSTAMHAVGKTVSLAVPVEAGDPDPVFDYDALSASADHVHVMAYDFHYEAGEHAGPVSPLGWVEGAIAYVGNVAGGARSGKFILGLPNYGLYGPEQPPDNFNTVACEPMIQCLAKVSGEYQTTTDHMNHCSTTDKPYAAGRAPNQYLANGDHLFFDDLESLEEKVAAAKRGKLGGITYWSIGGEPERDGCKSFFEMVRSHFPRR